MYISIVIIQILLELYCSTGIIAPQWLVTSDSICKFSFSRKFLATSPLTPDSNLHPNFIYCPQSIKYIFFFILPIIEILIFYRSKITSHKLSLNFMQI